jgi:hypothetical protein
LFNYGTNTVNLAGYYLTDNLTNEFQFLIPPGYTIPPHGFLLVWADKKTPTGSGDLHVNFKLSKSGESIGLYGADGNPVDYVNYGVQTDDVSEGRYPDGGGSLAFMPTATPRTNNLVPNTAPVLAFISNRVVTLGQTLSFTASATDTDQPPQTLTFSLGAGTPGNASIIPGNGFFSWTPAAAPVTNLFSIIVADSGVPSLSATQTFAAVVYLPPQLGGFGQVGNQFIFGWQAPPGQTSQVEFKDDLSTTTWTPLGVPITGSGNFITVTNDLNSSTQRFFRLRILP